MFISVIKQMSRHFKKTLVTYIGVTLFIILFDRIYATFSHGVGSLAMNLAFCYPLIGGFVFFGIISLIRPSIQSQTGYRLAFNLYNTGIATCLAASLIQGIFEIAGTDSNHLRYLYSTGVVFIIFGLGLILFAWVNSPKQHYTSIVKKEKATLRYRMD